MKKLILLLSLSLFSLNATQYILNLPKQKNSSIRVESSTNTPVVPEEPEVLSCVLPMILNQAQDACINNAEAVGWIDTSDGCGGMRSTNFDPNIVYARSKSSINNRNLEIPQGYRWLSYSEFVDLYNQSTLPNKHTDGDNSYAYFNKCGLSGYPVSQQEGQQQYSILFSQNGTGIHAGHYPTHHISYYTYEYSNNFLGYILYREY